MTSFMLLVMVLAADAPTPIVPAKWERAEPVDYAKDVQPIFAAKCLTCHAGQEPKGMYAMTGVDAIVKGGKKGAGVVPGKPDESALYMRSAHRQKPVMPPESEGNDLTPQELALVREWIVKGAKGPAVEAKAVRAVMPSAPAARVKPVRALAFAGSTLIAARGAAIRLIDAKTGDEVSLLSDANLKAATGAAHVSLVESLAVSPDGTRLASGSFREVILWDISTRKVFKRITGFADKVTAITWSRDGRRFATAGGAPTEDGELRIYNRDGALEREIKNAHSDTAFGVSFSPDGQRLASGGADKFVRVFDAATGKLLKSFEGHTQHVLDVAWGPDGNRLVSAGADDLVKIWDFDKGEKARDLKGHTKQVTRIAFGPGPQFYTSSGDFSARRWNVETGDPSKTFTDAKDCLDAVAVNADGTLLATGGVEGVVRLYDVKAGNLIRAIAFDKP